MNTEQADKNSDHPKNRNKKNGRYQRKTIWQSFLSQKPIKRLELATGAIAAILGLGYIVVQIWANLQTKWNFAAQQRPYVYFSGPPRAMVVRVGPDPDKRVYIIGFTTLINNGKSPAIHLIGSGEVIPGYGPDLDKKADEWFDAAGMPLKKSFDTALGMWIMPSGIGETESTLMQGQSKPFGFTQNKEVATIPKLPAVAVARIQYEDGSGNFYWTDACYYLPTADLGSRTEGTITSLVVPCSRHNDIR